MSGSQERVTVSLRVVVSKEKISQMEVVEDFESRPHKAVSCVVEREKVVKEWSEQRLPKVLPGYSGGRLPGRSTKEKGGEEGAVDEECEERKIRSQITQEVVARIKDEISVHSGDKEAVQRPAGQRVTRSWDCWQIEDEEEDVSWRRVPDGSTVGGRATTGGDRGTEKY